MPERAAGGPNLPGPVKLETREAFATEAAFNSELRESGALFVSELHAVAPAFVLVGLADERLPALRAGLVRGSIATHASLPMPTVAADRSGG